MAMHGTALGGGLEVAMAGHYRVAVPDAQMGQPEVNLGIIPGAEGTQRLPRLVGLEKAIEMCVSGKPIKAADALSAGLIDRIIEGDLAIGASAFAREMAGRTGALPKTRERQDKLPAASAIPGMLAAGRDLARKTRRNLEAPVAVVDALEAAATLPFADGCARERDIFFRLAQSEQAKALIHAFFAERGVSKVPGVSKDIVAAPVTSRRHRRRRHDGRRHRDGVRERRDLRCGSRIPRRGARRGIATIRKNYDVSVKRGRFTPAMVDERMTRISPQVGYDGFGDVDLVIEAVFENMALKKQTRRLRRVVGQIGRRCFATNTSTLDIDEIAAATGRAANVLGLHFFSPANVMRLVEIVRGKATSPETLATAMAVAKKLGKVGVVVGNCPGFVGNRMMFPYMYEAQFLVEDGATPQQVDDALTGFGMAMGMFAVDDMARPRRGVAGASGVESVQRAGRPQAARRRSSLRDGPLRTEDRQGLVRLRRRSQAAYPILRSSRSSSSSPSRTGIRRRSFTSEEIIERTIYALINEGARVLDEGYALRAADIDVIYTNGYGFPAWRGGPMFYADRVGLKKVYERVSAFHHELGQRWAPAPLLAQLAKEGTTFKELDKRRAGSLVGASS